MGETDFLTVSKNWINWFVVIDVENFKITDAYPLASYTHPSVHLSYRSGLFL